MRTVTGAETTVLNSAHFATFARVLVEDADGTYQDLTNQDSIDWVHSGRIAQTIDQIVATGDFTFWRKQEGGNSLAPLDEASLLNRDIVPAYAPLIDVGRGIRCDFATVAIGASPGGSDWKRVFTGVIDRWNVEDDFVTVAARDAIGAEIADRWIETETSYGTGPGRAMETVMQDILTAWTTGITLYTPASPSFLVTTYTQQRSSVMDALQQLAALVGSLSANVRETRSAQRIRVGRRQRKRTCWDCEREWKRMVVPLEPGGPSEARQLLRTRR